MTLVLYGTFAGPPETFPGQIRWLVQSNMPLQTDSAAGKGDSPSEANLGTFRALFPVLKLLTHIWFGNIIGKWKY